MLALKHRPPTSRTGLIDRRGVLEKLQTSQQPVTVVTAPAGYGKTTSLGQFHQRHKGSSAWLTLDELDSDPVVLLTDLTEVLSQGGLIADDAGMAFSTDSVLTRGMRALEERVEPNANSVLFIDQIDHLRSQSSLDVVGAVMTRLGGRIRVVAAARTGTGLPLGLLRAQGLLTEVDRDDLAMDRSEVTQLFAEMGVDVADDLDGIVEATEGWPAGVYLTALAVKNGAIDSTAVAVRGDHSFFAEYLRDELMAGTPPDVRRFVLRSSLLPRLSGPLCDSALDTADSQQMLAELEETNLLVVPLDHTRTWYRYHSLMQDFLRAEMSRHYSKETALIHSRAAQWFDQNGFGELAISSAKEANDLGQFVKLFAKHARSMASQGRLATLIEWVDWLEDVDALVDHGEFAALIAYVRCMEGNPGGAEHMGRYAFYDRQGAVRDDEHLGPIALMVRSMQFQRGPERALTDARLAIESITTDSQWLHLTGVSEAQALTARDGLEAAERAWMRTMEWGEAIGAHPTVSLALAERALIAIVHDDWAHARELTDRALVEIDRVEIASYLPSGLVFTLAARCASRAANTDEARAHLNSASRLRPRLSSAFPAISVQILHEMARAYIEVADMAGARRVMRDAADIVVARPKLGAFIADHEEIVDRLSSMPAGSVGASSLTSAELRLLPMLVTHLTYPEIGERLFISRHTVKTQAMSIYRKLSVSSRTEAVDKAREIGLLSL